jgi:hypothetical protein
LTIVSAQDKGAQEFIDAVWPGGELYTDEAEAFKDALGGKPYKTWWLLKPWVAKDVLSFTKRFGQSSSDVLDKKTQKLGGTIVFKEGKVVHVHRETATFDNGSAKELLAAVLGKPVSELGDITVTPSKEEEVCSIKRSP